MTDGWIKHTQGAFVLEVDWNVPQGQVLTLFGPSGSGKTTTLRAIAGLLRPNHGRIGIGGRRVFDSAEGVWVPPYERPVGYMAQQYGLFPHLRVSENVAYGLRRWGRQRAASRVRDLLSMLQIEDLAWRRPSSLSSGQRQRVALARALAPEPRLLLLDEPFAALDQELRRELRREIRAVRDRTGISTILVTHDWADALALSDDVLVLQQGRVTAHGPPLQVLRRPSAEVLSRLTDVENVLEGRVTAVDQAAGVMACDLEGVTLEAPYAPLQPGARVRIGVRAGDIIVATEAPAGLSARNILPGTVRSIADRGFEKEVLVDCGQPLRVEVTPRAIDRLGIAPGGRVWLVIKSNSCFLVE